MNTVYHVRVDDLSGPEIAALLAEHLQNLSAISPPESCHALNLEQLRRPDITFWSAWADTGLAGCGALKELDGTHGEVKSMRTSSRILRAGVATAVLREIILEARRRGYARLSLETGADPVAFAPAQALYRKFGFQRCAPFAEYQDDPNSLFMTLEL